MNTSTDRTCYISHPLTAEKTDDLRPALNGVLFERNLQPIYEDQSYEGDSILFSVCRGIYLADLCIFEVAKTSPQIYIEIGIALAYNKPIIILVEKEQPLPLAFQMHSIVSYQSYAELSKIIGAIIDNVIERASANKDEFCIFCNKICESMLTRQDKNSFTMLNKRGLVHRADWEQIKQIMDSYFSTYHMYPTYLIEADTYSQLCDIKSKIYSSRFTFCNPGIMSDELSYLGLGLTIGKRYPWILVRRTSDKNWPTILNGMGAIGYESFMELSSNLENSIGEFARDVTPSQQMKINKTHEIGMLPFWLQMDDWIAVQNSKLWVSQAKITGDLKLIRSLGPGVIDKFIIPPSGLTLGANKNCDVVIDHEYASGSHAQIVIGKHGNYYIEDLDSKNGTYLNGKRIPSRRLVEITVNSIIRIPGARLLVADDTSNLFAFNEQPRLDVINKKSNDFFYIVEKREQTTRNSNYFRYLLQTTIGLYSVTQKRNFSDVLDEMNDQLGYGRKSMTIQTWLEENTIPSSAEVEYFAKKITAVTNLDYKWVKNFFDAAGYKVPDKLSDSEIIATDNSNGTILPANKSNVTIQYIGDSEKPADIFISYARSDIKIVQSIFRSLKKNRHRPWLDVYSIKGGEDWFRSINTAIDECGIFLAILSNNSVSRRGVIQKELKKALDKWEGMLPNDIYIVPLRIDDCPIPELLKDLQVINWDSGKGRKKLLEAIRVGLARRKSIG